MARDSGGARRLGTEAARRVFSFGFVGDVASELRRVTWPNRQETMRLTMMVIAVSVTVGAFLWFVDLGFSSIMNPILRR